MAFKPGALEGCGELIPLCPVYISHREAMSLSFFVREKITWEAPSLVQRTCSPKKGHEAREGKSPAQTAHQVWKG